jgi:acylphosphatase
MGTARKKVFVSGHVQGVFFRYTCRQVAEGEGVDCRATNLEDGRVEVLLEGAPDAVERVVKWCHEGPEHAHVTGVEVSDL